MADGAVRSYFVDITGSSEGLIRAAGQGEAAAASLETRAGAVGTSFAGVGSAATTHLGGKATEQANVLERAVGKVDNAIKGAIGSVVSMGAQFAGLGAVMGFGAALDIGIKDAVSFQQKLLLIQTQAGDTTDNLQQLGNALDEMAPKVGQTPDQLAQGFFHLASAGYTGAQALDMLQQSAELAAVGQSDLESTTNAVVGVMKSGVGGIKDASDAVGVLNAIVGSGNMHLQDLVDAMGTGVLPVAATFGLSIQSLGAAMTFLSDQSIPPIDAANELRRVITTLGAPTAQAAKLLTDAGVGAQDAADSTSAMQRALVAAHVTTTQMSEDLKQPDGLVVALSDLKQHMDDAGVSADEQAATIARAFGGSKMAAPVLDLYKNLDQVKGKFDQINKAAGAFPADWAAQQKTGAQALQDVKAAADVALTSLGTGLLPYVEQLGQWVAAHSGDIERFGATLGKDIGIAAHDAGQFIQHDLIPAVKDVGGFIGEHLQAFKDLGLAIGALYVTHKGVSLVGGLAGDLQSLLGLAGKVSGLGGAGGIGAMHVWVDNPGFGGAGTSAGGALADGEMAAAGGTWGAAAAGTLRNLLPATALVFAGQIVSDLNLKIDGVHWPPSQSDVNKGIATGNLSTATGIPTAPGGPWSPGAYGINRDTILEALGLKSNTPVITDAQKQTAHADMQMIDDLLGRGVNDMQGLATGALGLNTYMNKYGAMSDSDIAAFANLWADGVTKQSSIHSDIDLLHSYTAKYGPLSSSDLATFAQLVAAGKRDVDDIHNNLSGAAGNASSLTSNLGGASISAADLAREIAGIRANLPSSDFGNIAPSNAAGGSINAAAAGGPEGNRVFVGEHGPELVDLPAGSYVHPNFGGNGFGQMGGSGGAMGGGGDTYNTFTGPIHIEGVQDPAAFFEAVQKEALRQRYNQGQMPVFGR